MQRRHGISDQWMFMCDHVVTFVRFSRICMLLSARDILLPTDQNITSLIIVTSEQ
jgi:hypothetical protein